MLFAYLVCIAHITNLHVQTFCLWKTLCSRKNQKRKKALGKKKKSFVKATGTGGAPRCHPDYEQNKMSNTILKRGLLLFMQVPALIRKHQQSPRIVILGAVC